MIEADGVEIPIAVRRRESRMKALRRSIKGERDAKSPHISISQKSAMAITAPKKVIKALHDYDPTGPDQLAFAKGDFFHVVSREDDEIWYEACNPATGAKGLVPVKYFQALGKSEPGRDRMSSGSTIAGKPPHDSAYSGSSESLPTSSHKSRNSASIRHATAYGMVQYDFAAERPDELQAKVGEYIIIIAQSTEEWYVAKPIGRLGGPGLIPVSYIELRNMANGKSLSPEDQMAARAAIPPVEEWKRTQADYKNSSIPLGRIDEPTNYGAQQGLNGNNSYQNGHQNPPQQFDQARNIDPSEGETSNGYTPPRAEWNELPAAANASIPRYCHSGDKFWFVIEAQMEDGSLWQFSRFYEDFYDLQVALLKNFPDEAGTRGGGERVIPFLPGPMPYVTDALTEMRQEQLNTYLRQLVALDLRLSRSIFVKGFFSPKQGDFELDPDAPTDYSRYSQASMNSNHGAGVNSSQQAHRQQYGNNNGASQSPNQQYMGMGNSNERQFSYGQGQVPIQPSRLDDMYQDQNELGSSQQSNAPPGSSAAAIKFKLHYEDNIFVVRVPPDITFNQLRYKVLDRCNVQHDVEISYKDEARSGGLVPLLSDRDWMYAVENAEKLGLYVS